jgi:hypothetical protein
LSAVISPDPFHKTFGLVSESFTFPIGTTNIQVADSTLPDANRFLGPGFHGNAEQEQCSNQMYDFFHDASPITRLVGRAI